MRFAFVDFHTADGVLRAMKHLPPITSRIGGAAPMLFKVDTKVEDFLAAYEPEHRIYTEHMAALEAARADQTGEIQPAPAQPILLPPLVGDVLPREDVHAVCGVEVSPLIDWPLAG